MSIGEHERASANTNKHERGMSNQEVRTSGGEYEQSWASTSGIVGMTLLVFVSCFLHVVFF
jgi:hypothetical protein